MVLPKLMRHALLLIICTLLFSGCAKPPVRRTIEATAYCNCSQCCGWERGRWLYLKLDFWNKYIAYGKYEGQKYSGLTASGTKPHEPVPGLFSVDSLYHPWMIPFRIVFFPWYMLPGDGTIAADTRYYPFGTRMNVPGYGWGVVEDRGGGIKGPDRIDIYFGSHGDALVWGRRRVSVEIEYP